MNTAEVAIEHILTGALALCAFVLPLFSGRTIDDKMLQTEVLIGVVGLAYLFGVVFDRIADSILSPIEQHLRLTLAEKWLTKRPSTKTDPFPQDELEFSLRGDEGRREWMDSLRSRIRTSRGLSVFGAPAAMGVVMFNHYRPDQGAGQMIWPWQARLVVGLNLLFVVLSILVPWILTSEKSRWKERFKTFKTEDLVIVIPAGTSPEEAFSRQMLMEKAKKHRLWFSFFYLLMVLNSLAATSYVLAASWLTRFVVFVCGAVAIFLPLWVWHRITATYMSFVYRKLPKAPQN